MSRSSLITDEMRDAIGVTSARRTHIVEAGAVRQFAEAVGDPNPLYASGATAPPTFPRSFDVTPPAPEFDIPLPDILDGGSAWEFFGPIAPGDEITAATKVCGVSEKTGRLGQMLLVVRQHVYTHRSGQTMATQTSTTIYYSASASPPAGGVRGQTPSAQGGSCGAADDTGEGVYTEDVSVGTRIRPLIKTPTTRQLVQYAGASGDFYEIHYDQGYARSAGLPDVIVHGALKSAFLAQALGEWAGDSGALLKMDVQYRGMDKVNERITCAGTVSSVLGGGLVECDVWTEREDGVRTTVGKAVVSLGSRSGA